MSLDDDTANVQFPEVNGPGPGSAEVDVETYRTLEVAKDLAAEFRFDGIPMRDPKTGEVFVISAQGVGEYMDLLTGIASA